MIRPIMRQRFFLARPSETATEADLAVLQDLVETLEAHRATCVGMAANMIGQRKRIIAVVDDDGSILAMLNPRIVQRSGEYQTEEGCLSLDGVRPTTRYRNIVVEYEDAEMRPHSAKRRGHVAQAIQHEIDHCDGIII